MPATSTTPSSKASSSSKNLSAETPAARNNNNALLGATRAFSRPPPPPPPPTTTTIVTASPLHDVRSNGALAAASTSSARSRGTSPARTAVSTLASPSAVPRDTILSWPAGHRGSTLMSDHASLDFSNMPRISPPQDGRSAHNTFTSASQQAAVLAAARAPPPTTAPGSTHRGLQRSATTSRPAVAPKPRRLSGQHTKIAPNEAANHAPTDTSSIAPTTSLVDLFEQHSKDAHASGKRPGPIVIKPSEDLALKSPQPVRSGITSMFQLKLPDKTVRQEEEGQLADISAGRPLPSDHDGHSSSDDSFASASEDLNPRSPPASPPPATLRQVSKTVSPSPGAMLRIENEAKRRPGASPSRSSNATTNPIQIKLAPRPATSHSDAMSISSSQSLRTIPAQFNQAYPRRMTPLTTGDDLANALVASSLASSRAASPMRLEAPPLVPNRKPKSQHHSILSFSRTPSPAKASGMLHTLRKPDPSPSSSDDDQHPYGKHRKKRLVRKHPNKHHEGERKRWRDAVTDRERKRYEGVWAANKGLHCTAPTDQISNLVAREIWLRSRLPETVLETVWDLVDTEHTGRLQREEFVVGLWLVDQRLKGRKLPVRVSETVWASVRSIQGIKIRK